MNIVACVRQQSQGVNQAAPIGCADLVRCWRHYADPQADRAR